VSASASRGCVVRPQPASSSPDQNRLHRPSAHLHLHFIISRSALRAFSPPLHPRPYPIVLSPPITCISISKLFLFLGLALSSHHSSRRATSRPSFRNFPGCRLETGPIAPSCHRDQQLDRSYSTHFRTLSVCSAEQCVCQSFSTRFNPTTGPDLHTVTSTHLPHHLASSRRILRPSRFHFEISPFSLGVRSHSSNLTFLMLLHQPIMSSMSGDMILPVQAAPPQSPPRQSSILISRSTGASYERPERARTSHACEPCTWFSCRPKETRF
jgi:hypothetical protein